MFASKKSVVVSVRHTSALEKETPGERASLFRTGKKKPASLFAGRRTS
jgi:hypothetical protein